jgi:RNA polymerase sigma factor (sigma-70 family)
VILDEEALFYEIKKLWPYILYQQNKSDPMEADDVAQETWFIARNALRTGKVKDPKKIRAYLKGIIRSISKVRNKTKLREQRARIAARGQDIPLKIEGGVSVELFAINKPVKLLQPKETPQVLEMLIQAEQSLNHLNHISINLTERQREAVQLIAQGKTYQEAAEQMKITYKGFINLIDKTRSNLKSQNFIEHE